MREKETLTPNAMKNIKTLIENTKGMNPNQFEAYCEANGIQNEWLDVTLTNFNDGVYHTMLPEYRSRCVYSFNGGPIEFSF